MDAQATGVPGASETYSPNGRALRNQKHPSSLNRHCWPLGATNDGSRPMRASLFVLAAATMLAAVPVSSASAQGVRIEGPGVVVYSFDRIEGVSLMAIRLAALVALLLAPVLSSPTAAQDYPSRPVRIIVPFGAGGPADVFARVLAQHLSDAFKQSFVVEDRPGAGSIIGTDAVAKSPPDGYTLLVMSNTHTTNESLIPNKPFQLMRDFVPIAPINYSDLIMVMHPSVPAKALKEFVALAKSKPGQLNYASSGPGTPYHMAGELFKAMSGTDIVHVPHKASGEARNSVLGGHVQMMFDAISTMASNVRAGQVVALGTTGKKRSAIMPEVPTVDEAGVPGYEATIWIGLMAPAGTPKEIVDKLNGEIQKALAREDVIEAWVKQGAVPMLMTPDEFDKYLRADIDKWANVVKVSGATAQ